MIEKAVCLTVRDQKSREEVICGGTSKAVSKNEAILSSLGIRHIQEEVIVILADTIGDSQEP